MISTILSLLLGVLVVLAISALTGYFVAQEFGYMAVDRSRLKARAGAGDVGATRALGITSRTSFMLSGAQLGITVTGLLVGYVAEPLIGQSIGTLLSGPDGGTGIPLGVGVAIGTVLALLFATVVQMVFGELFPKNLAIARPEPVALWLALSTGIYLRLFGWIIRIFDAASNLLLRMLRIEPVPAGAQVALDGVLLGRGVWEGRVRPGAHRVEVAAEGFLTRTLTPRVGDDGIVKVVAEPERDPTSPEWQKKNPPRVVLSLVLTPAIGPSLGGDLDDCDDCSAGPAYGGRASLRGGYQLGLGIGLFADVGYLALVQRIHDRAATLFGVAETERDRGTIDDRVFMHGVTVGGALGYAVPGLDPWSLRARVGAGMMIGEASVTRRGDFTSASGEAYAVGDYVEKASALFAYVAPEARFGYRILDRLEVNLGLSASIGIAVDAPSWRDQRPVPSATPFFGRFNAPGEEPAMVGTFVVLSPDLGLLVDF